MGDVARVLDSVREVAVAMARLEKRPVEVETPAATSEPHLPPPVPQYPSVPTVPPVTSHYELLAMPMPVRHHLGRKRVTRLRPPFRDSLSRVRAHAFMCTSRGRGGMLSFSLGTVDASSMVAQILR